jgi:hypothetical protein
MLSAVGLLTVIAVMAEFATQNTPNQSQATVRVARYLIDQTVTLVLSVLLLTAGVYGMRATADRRSVVHLAPYVLSSARKYYGLNVAILVMGLAGGALSGAYSTLIILEWPNISQRGWAVGFVWTWLLLIFLTAAYLTFVTWSYMKTLQLAEAGELEGEFVVRTGPVKLPAAGRKPGRPAAGRSSSQSRVQKQQDKGGKPASPDSGTGKVYPGGSV